MKYDGVTLTTGNGKLGNRVLNVSLPPGITCGVSVKCFKSCYAKRSARRANVWAAWNGNYRVWMESPLAYFAAIGKAIKANPKCDRFRWHVGGDIPAFSYYERMIDTANAFPKVRFLCFTKRHNWVTESRLTGKLPVPANLTVVLSYWNGYGNTDGLEQSRSAWYLDPKDPDPRIPATAKLCSGGCDKCTACWDLLPGESVKFKKH